MNARALILHRASLLAFALVLSLEAAGAVQAETAAPTGEYQVLWLTLGGTPWAKLSP